MTAFYFCLQSNCSTLEVPNELYCAVLLMFKYFETCSCKNIFKIRVLSKTTKPTKEEIQVIILTVRSILK